MGVEHKIGPTGKTYCGRTLASNGTGNPCKSCAKVNWVETGKTVADLRNEASETERFNDLYERARSLGYTNDSAARVADAFTEVWGIVDPCAKHPAHSTTIRDGYAVDSCEACDVIKLTDDAGYTLEGWQATQARWAEETARILAEEAAYERNVNDPELVAYTMDTGTGVCTPVTDEAKPTYRGKTADQWRAEAKDCRKAREDSWERSDTDGFLSQAASQAMAGEYELCAEIADNGGVWEFPAVFDLNGVLVAIHERQNEYGRFYVNAGPGGNTAPRFIKPSKARDGLKARENNERKGFRIGRVSCVPDVRMSAQWHSYVAMPDHLKLKDVTVVDDATVSGIETLKGLLKLS